MAIGITYKTDSIISEFDHGKIDSFSGILKGKNKEVIDNLNDDDNSCLIKYTKKSRHY